MEATIAVLAEDEEPIVFRLVADLAHSATVALPVIGGHHFGCFVRQAQTERVGTGVTVRAVDELSRGAAAPFQQGLVADVALWLGHQSRSQTLGRRRTALLLLARGAWNRRWLAGGLLG